MVHAFLREPVDLAAVATVFTPNLTRGSYLRVALAANSTIANPSGGMVPGSEFVLQVTQDATGGRAITWGSQYVFGDFGGVNDAPSAVTILRGFVATSTLIILTAASGVGSATEQIALVENAAIPAGARYVFLTVDGVDTSTLPNGTREGQEIEIWCVAATTSPACTLTITDVFGTEPSTWVFTEQHQYLRFVWRVGASAALTGWKLVGLYENGVETLVAGATANPLCLTHLYNCDAANDWIQPAGLVAGQRSRWVASGAGAVGSTISGLFYTTLGAATGVDLQTNAQGEVAQLSWSGSRWWPDTLTGITVA